MNTYSISVIEKSARYRLKYLTILIILSCSSISYAQNRDSTISKLTLVADKIIRESSFKFIDPHTGKYYQSTDEVPDNITVKPTGVYNDWRYWNGVLNIAMLEISKVLSIGKYKNFALRNIEFAFDNYEYFQLRYNNEGKWNYPFGQRFILEELDDGGAMGASVIEVNKIDHQNRYDKYINEVAGHMMHKQSRLEDSTFVRSFPHKWTLWADDLYMGLSFLCRMGEVTGDHSYFNDAAAQVIKFHKYLFNDNLGIMSHCWYSDVDRNGVAYWGRANGWALLAQVDLLDHLPKDHPDRNKLIYLLQKHLLGVAKYQSQSGLWHQLIDKVDSYLETSCSAMITYTVARAVNKGYIEPRYLSIAQRGWEGIMSKISDEGLIYGVCTGTIVSDDLVYYYKRPTPVNDVHGIGFILLAGKEILNSEKNN